MSELTPPKRYNIVFLNDDTTHADFVESILGFVFRMTEEEIAQSLAIIEREGRLVVQKETTREIAEHKMRMVMKEFRRFGEGLPVVIEPAEEPA